MIIPVNDSRYPSRNIRLSAALCALGFAVKHDAEPCTVTIDAITHKRVVTFWHDPVMPPDSAIALDLQKRKLEVKAIDIDAWWRTPDRYTIAGYDDALNAMRSVLEAREWLLGLVHGSQRLSNDRLRVSDARAKSEPRAGQVKTSDLHIASVIRAAGVPVVAYEKRDRRFIFPKAAIPIAELIAQESDERASVIVNKQRDTVNQHGRDLCVDWMLWALKYRDWLHGFVRNPLCVPVLEFREDDRVAMMSANLPEKQQRELLSHF